MNNSLSLPRTIGVDGVISYGGGTGNGLNLARKAFGEYFERNHFFLSVPIYSKHTIDDFNSIPLRKKLIECVSQIQLSDSPCQNHIFSFSKVQNLVDDTPKEYFYNAISLNGEKKDGNFYHFNDSCSCATHTSKEKALRNSLLEFIERQALLGSWISKTYRYAIKPEVLLELSPYAELVKTLLSNGTLYIFENGLNLPGYSTIIFYLSACKDDLVQYSVGSSAGFSLAESLQGSLEELWQCYLFQYNAENSKGLEDRSGSGYHMSFQQCNHPGIRDIIPFINESQVIEYKIKTADEVVSQPIFSFNQAVEQLTKITNEIYYYHHYEPAFDLHFTKIVSPDFFAHMALEQKINLINPYSESLGITKNNAYLEKIPFP